RTTTAADQPRCRRDAATMRTARFYRSPRRRRPPWRTRWARRLPQRVPRLRSYSGAKAHGHRFTAGVGDGGGGASRARTTTWRHRDERPRRRRWLRRRRRDHDAPLAATVGRPRCRLTDEFSGGVLSVL